MSITKSELIERVASKHDQLSAKDVELAIKTILEEMSKTLATGGRIEIRGFGSFSLHYREPRVGRNPKTGESVDLEAKHVPHFKPGKELRDRVNQSMQLEQDFGGGEIIEAGEGQPADIKDQISKTMGRGTGGSESSGRSEASSSLSASPSGDIGGPILSASAHKHRSSGNERSTGFMN